MKLSEVKLPKSKLGILDMRQQVKEFCELFAPDNDGDVSVETFSGQRCYYLFGLQPKQKELFKTWLRKHGFYVSGDYDPAGAGVEWSYTPFPEE